MKFSKVLCRQHIDRMFKAHWRVQGKRVPIETKAEETLAAKSIPVFDPQEVVKEKRPPIKIDVTGYLPKPVLLDESHVNWHKNVCYFYRDDNVLLEGINQAKIITKTVELTKGLPNKIQLASKLSKDINNKVLKTIFSSHLFDTEQVKLPKIKDPNRPAFVFPRIYGISQDRAQTLLITKLLQLCELLADKNILKERIILNDANFFVPLEKEGNLLQLELNANKLLLSLKPLDILTTESTDEFNLPDLYPIKHTITLVPEHIYESNTIYPVNKNFMKFHPHTIFVYYNSTKVTNIYEEEVTESQILGRSLMKTFAVAASYARQKYGNDVKILPHPVVLQCVHTDGKRFHFSMLQLNTLNLEEGGIKNIWYHIPRMSLFETCEYKLGKPIVEGYNPEVMKYLLAFYNNI